MSSARWLSSPSGPRLARSEHDVGQIHEREHEIETVRQGER